MAPNFARSLNVTTTAESRYSAAEASEGCAPATAGDGADDARFMELAVAEARAAGAADEVPVGCVIVVEGRVVGSGRNRTRELGDPTAHAEMLAIRSASSELGALRSIDALRLGGATVYTTVEPCFMCAGALSHARVARVVWAVRDPKFGGAVSLGNVLTDARLNHRCTIAEGVCADEVRELLRSFFEVKRRRARA